MANTKSAKKMIRVNERRRLRNKRVKSQIKRAFKKARIAIEQKSEDALQKAVLAMRVIDKAVSKGVVHKNKAARKKSRLFKHLNKAKAV